MSRYQKYVIIPATSWRGIQEHSKCGHHSRQLADRQKKYIKRLFKSLFDHDDFYLPEVDSAFKRAGAVYCFVFIHTLHD